MNNPTTRQMERKCYTVLEIAQMLGISRSAAYQLTKEGLFSVTRIGSSIRISKKSFDKWLNSGEVE